MNRTGRLLERVGRRLAAAGPSAGEPWAEFMSPEARWINSARLAHLATLSLPLAGRRVLEVGAGIGLHTRFFEDLNCDVLSTDGQNEHVNEIRRRYPWRRVEVLDLEDEEAIRRCGPFDIIHCYGVLYHLSSPHRVLAALSQVCQALILLETCVTPGGHSDMHLVREGSSSNQALRGIGCRPTRPWVMERLRADWGFGYVPRTQPCHPDFEQDWQVPSKRAPRRAIFIGSKAPLENSLLVSDLPDRQPCACGGQHADQ